MLYGPVPVRKSVVIAPRYAPPGAIRIQPAARLYAQAEAPIFFTPADQPEPVYAVEQPMPVPPPRKKRAEPPPFVAPAAKKAALPPPAKHAFAPVVRKPGEFEPRRFPRGTNAPQGDFFEDEAMTMEAGRGFDDMITGKAPLVDNTEQVQLFETDEFTHVEDDVS